MNSSGIKRGLAGSAVAALAVTGIPFLASSADAATGDVIQVQSTGTARNAGDQGALVVLNTRGIDPTLLDLAGTDLTNDGENNATQSAEIVPGSATRIASGATGDLTPGNGLDQISLRVAATTPPGGDNTADFTVFEDEDGDSAVDLTEARTQASVKTTGPAASVDVTPSSQSAPSGEPSAAYTVTIRDADGNVTQLDSSESLTLDNGTGDATFGGAGDGDVIDADEILDGTAQFTAEGTATGPQTFTVAAVDTDAPSDVSGSDTAVLNVTASATLTNDDIDVVTGADSSNGGSAEDPTYVRIDQSSVRLDIDSNDAADANSTVTFTVTGNGVTFNGGKPTTTVTTTLDANGVGSVTITPDAGSIQAGDGFTVNGAGISNLDFVFERSEVSAASVDAPSLVYTQVDTPTSVTVTVTDQFGNPAAGAQVSAESAGTGVNNTQPRQTTNAAGQTTFTFPAGDTQAGDVDTITYTVFQDAATPDGDGIPATEDTTVKYTADGKGPDYQITLDSLSTEAPTYSPDDVTVIPLADAVADNNGGPTGDEIAHLTIASGEAGAPVTVSVDNGALILSGGNKLTDGKSSVTGQVGDTFEIVGTKSGIVTVTTTSGGRTETAQLTVEGQTDPNTARNVTVSGPATVPAGTDQITYTAVVTDAFGNPIANFPRSVIGDELLNIQVSGPGHFQDGDTQSNANGEIKLNVAVDSGAAGDITIKVTGQNGAFLGGTQFGAQADRLTATSNSDDAKGLPASSNVATATTAVEGPVVEPTVQYPHMHVKGIDKGKRDLLQVDAIDAAGGATVTLYRRIPGADLKPIKEAVLNENGDFTFRVHDGNGTKVTRYTVKLTGNEAVRPANKSRRVK
jgi:hypothetical protein